MESFLIDPAKAPLAGEARVPGDKSIGHRAVLFAGLGNGQSVISGLSGGQDNQRTVEALTALGIEVHPAGPGRLKIEGRGLFGLRAPERDLDCGNSGTSIRLLSGVLSAQRFSSRLCGDRYLNARPMRRVVNPLSRMGGVLYGVPGAKEGDLYPPLSIDPAQSLHGIRHESHIASAQVKSAVLLCSLWAEGVTEVVEPTRSRDHTERMLRALGAPIFTSDDTPPPSMPALSRLSPSGWKRELPAVALEVPGDLSSAAFLLGAALLVPGSRVVLSGVGLNRSRTGVLDAFEQLCPGAVTVHERREVQGEEIGDLHMIAPPDQGLRPMRIDGTLSVRALDELPLLAALSGLALGETVIAGAKELRVKESDRIVATCALLRAFGVECEERPDGLVVQGRGRGPLRAARVDSFGDHRIAMAGAVLALAAPSQSRIEDTANVNTSFPGFVGTLYSLGARIHIVR